jgi:hypothetical protein
MHYSGENLLANARYQIARIGALPLEEQEG